ncbi:MAG TPA: hypothetical protein VM122_14470 [Usitatibacter sp.]|nr:hypothetical protein [Usitatibacter sp.]
MKAVVRDIEQRLKLAATPADRLAALIELAHAEASAYRNREGLRAAREALQIARGRGDAVAICRALSAATLCHYQRCDYVAAVATGLDAIAAYADGDLRSRSGAEQSVALALYCVGAHDVAQSTARRAIADAQGGHDERCVAAARDVLGVVLAQSGQFNAARREFRQAGAVYGRRGDDTRVKKVTASLGNTYRDQGNVAEGWGRLPQARFYWKQATRVYRIALGLGEAEGDAIDALLLAGLGECELRLGDAPAAQISIDRALKAADDCPTLLAPCHLWQGRILHALGELKPAERAFERARRAAERLEHGDMLVTCLTAQSAIADQLGRFETAADLEKRAQEVAADRAALMAQVREQLAQLWDRYTGPAERDNPRAAA